MPVTEDTAKSGKIVTIGNSMFITEQQLELWSAKELLGTNMVKPYLHGYLIDKPLYKKIKDAFDEFSYDEYKRKKASERLEEKIKKSMRIPVISISFRFVIRRLKSTRIMLGNYWKLQLLPLIVLASALVPNKLRRSKKRL